MKLRELYSSEEEVEKFLFEMANITSKKTGIERVVIWASQAQDGAKRHGPRVKVSSSYTSSVKPDDFFVLTIQEQPRVVAGECSLSNDDLQDVKDWVSVNRDALLEYWNDGVSTEDFLAKLVRVGQA